jgi:hypothetical protein
MTALRIEAAKAIDLNDWWMVLWGGEWFVGRRADHKLSSLQKLQMPFSLIEGPGGLPRPHLAFMTYPWVLETLVMPADALWISLTGVKNPDQTRMAIYTTEKLKLEERANRSGIHLATQ